MSTVASNLRVFPGFSWRDSARRFKDMVLASILAWATLFGEMPFLDHLEELRRRLIRCLIALGVGTGIGLVYTAQLIEFLGRPAAAAGVPLMAIDATGIFSLYFKVAAAAGICLAAPVMLWQIWRFIEPALYAHEKRYSRPFIILTTLCFVIGAAFGYVIVAPWLFKLEMAMAQDAGIHMNMSAESYFTMLVATVVAMGAIFEMPPIVFVLSRIGLISAKFLIRNFKYAVFVFSIAAAVLTPSTTPPPMLFFMAVMTGLYGVCIVVAMVFGRTRKADEEAV
jgi:sec-independent protein translocase protein TatC